jgi:hypothetical protein
LTLGYKVSHTLPLAFVESQATISASSESVASSLDTSVTSVIEASLPGLIPLQQSPEAFNAEYLQNHADPRAKIGGALATLKIQGYEAGRAEAEDLVFQMLHPEAKTTVQVRIHPECYPGNPN